WCCHWKQRCQPTPRASTRCDREIMRKTLTDQLLRSLKPKSEPYDIWDAVVPSLGARVLPSGIVSFILGARFPGGRHYTRRALSSYSELTLLEARAKALRDLHANSFNAVCRSPNKLSQLPHRCHGIWDRSQRVIATCTSLASAAAPSCRELVASQKL